MSDLVVRDAPDVISLADSNLDFLKSDYFMTFKFLLTVSSEQMEWTWVPNMTAVKIRKRRASKQRRMRRMTVAGGEKLLHSGKEE